MSEFIKTFQSQHHLKDDGIIGKNTLLKLKEVLAISSLEGLAHFVGNCWVESMGFTRFEENLNYSKEGLLRTFRSDFDWNKDRQFNPIELAKAVELARKPEQIANFVYANQNGNGDESTGDGWKYRGRGCLQTTGKTNYIQLGEFLGINLMNEPDLVATEYALSSAVFYFTKNKVWDKANAVDDATIKRVRRAINGGYNGLDEVSEKVKYFYSLLV